MALTPEVKLRTLASGDVTLQGYLGTGPFRWFDRQVPQGYYPKTCVRIRRISTLILYEQRGLHPLDQPRFQLDVLDPDPEKARAVAAYIIQTFLTGISLAQNNQFGSPVTTPPQFPNFVLNQRAGMDYQMQPPAYVESIDFRAWNTEV